MSRENTPDKEYKNLDLRGYPTSMKNFGLSRHPDSLTLYIHKDESHGDRQFTLSEKDAVKLRDALNQLYPER